MAAYLIAIPEGILDVKGMQEYGANTPAIVESFGGRYLVPRATTRTLEGSWDPRLMILIESRRWTSCVSSTSRPNTAPGRSSARKPRRPRP